MAGYIFQINNEIINENEMMTESDFYELDFLDNMIQYVSENSSITADCFFDQIKDIAKINKEEKSFIFNNDAKEKYFNNQYIRFKNKVETLTLDAFINDSTTLWELKNLIDSVFDDYIYTSYCRTMDQFMREMVPGQTYYLGSILMYK